MSESLPKLHLHLFLKLYVLVLLATPEARALGSVARCNDRVYQGLPCRGPGHIDPATRAGDAIRTIRRTPQQADFTD
jgi:hypothetical protein